MRLVGGLVQDELGEDGGGEHPTVSRFGAQSRLAMREGRIIGLKSERQRILVDDKTVMVGISKVANGQLLLLETNLVWNILPTLGSFPFLVVDTYAPCSQNPIVISFSHEKRFID
jgi:hypothetical protein